MNIQKCSGVKALTALGVTLLAVTALAACATPSAQVPAAETAIAGVDTAAASATVVAGATAVAEAMPTPTIATMVAGPTVKTADDARLGTILVDAEGFTLYRFANDQGNVSACYDQCATNWPPLIVTGQPSLPTGVPGIIGTSMRDDGSMQVTYNGMPLYRFVRDMSAGDTTGQGVGGNWFVINASDTP